MKKFGFWSIIKRGAKRIIRLFVLKGSKKTTEWTTKIIISVVRSNSSIEDNFRTLIDQHYLIMKDERCTFLLTLFSGRMFLWALRQKMQATILIKRHLLLINKLILLEPIHVRQKKQHRLQNIPRQKSRKNLDDYARRWISGVCLWVLCDKFCLSMKKHRLLSFLKQRKKMNSFSS